MHPLVHAIMSHPVMRAQVEHALAARGRGGDDNIVHVNDSEMARLKAWGGSGTINPKTGLREFTKDPRGDIGGGENHDNQPGGDHGMGGNVGNSGGGGGYGNASDGHSSEGSGAGAGGGHSGGNITVDNPQQPVIQQPQIPQQPPPPVTLPPPPPTNIPTTPLMSQTAGSNLIGNRFGALPGWATQSYQIGTAPLSYPVSGQPFGNSPVSPPPVVAPPVTPGGGNPGGGNPGGGNPGIGGNPFGGDGTGARNPWNQPGGNPTTGGTVTGGGNPTIPGVGVGSGGNAALIPSVGNFVNALHANGIGLGNNPLSHQTPGFADIIAGPTTSVGANQGIGIGNGGNAATIPGVGAFVNALHANGIGLPATPAVAPSVPAQPPLTALQKLNLAANNGNGAQQAKPPPQAPATTAAARVTAAGTPITQQAPAGSLAQLMQPARPQVAPNSLTKAPAKPRKPASNTGGAPRNQ